MTEEKKPTITIHFSHDNYKIGLTAQQARDVFYGLLAIFRGGADHYFWPEGKITTSGGGEII